MKKQVIDLSGPDGNAFVLMGLATRLCKVTGKDSKEIVADMVSGDYEHLINVFEKHFGDLVELQH